MAPTPEHIVFDIGRVLLVWDPERPFRRLIPDEVKRRWFLDTVCTLGCVPFRVDGCAGPGCGNPFHSTGSLSYTGAGRFVAMKNENPRKTENEQTQNNTH